MRWCWLLLVPNLCLARIVQIEELVKNDKPISPGAALHETAGRVIERPEVWSDYRYSLKPVFRYRFGGIVREAGRSYIQIAVDNLLMEEAAARNLNQQHSSKAGPPPPQLVVRATRFDLLLATDNGRAAFPFPRHVTTESNEQRVEVSEAVLEIVGRQVRVVESVRKTYPAAVLPWLPPREWPNKREIVRIEWKPKPDAK